MKFTLETRLHLTPDQDKILGSYSSQMSSAKRKIIAKILAKKFS